MCKRVLNKCQAIVFSDEHNDGTSRAPPLPNQKVKENVLPAIVGIGAMLAGIGQPLMTRPAGQIAIAQGRRNRTLSITSNPPTTLTRRNTTDNTIRPENEPDHAKRSIASDIAPSYHQPYLSASHPDLSVSKKKHVHFNPFTSSPSLEDLHRGKAFSVARYIKTAQQKLNLKINQEDKSNSNKNFESLSVFDPKLTALGQSSVPTNTAPRSPVLSDCSSSEDISRKYVKSSKLSTSIESYDSDHSHHETSSSSSDEEVSEQKTLSKLSLENRKILLRSNYFRSEMQFLLALVDIATRLVIVPKEARMSALQAELTLLNHNLPAEICLPLWCPATTEKPYHHRIVRISPSDAVVLNSAERV